MKANTTWLLLFLGAFAAALVIFRPRPKTPEPPAAAPAEPARAESAPEAMAIGRANPRAPSSASANENQPTHLAPERPGASLNKAERLAQLRESFRALAAGDPGTALRAAKQIKDPTERETALLALVTEWTRGELAPPQQRAWAIATYGLEAGLGCELAKYPELAVLWANELTGGPVRAVVVSQAAATLLDTDPAAAFALGQDFPQDERRRFLDSVYAAWAQKDTEAALQWAGQMPDPAEQAAALQAIRTVAPVGIGAELSSDNGYAVVRGLVSGNPAEFGGQLRPGDRILAIAQGDNAFTDVRGRSLQDVVQMIRGAPGTLVQLQVLPADNVAEPSPRTVSIVRGQIKFKR